MERATCFDMKRSSIIYDGKNMRVGAASLASRLDAARRAVVADSTEGRQGWLLLPDDREMVKRIERMVKEKKGFSTILVLGIGGSDLGTRAIVKALKGKGMSVEFAGANTDPDELFDILQRLDLRHTLVNIVSKSGDTIEPMSAFHIVRERLQKQVGKRGVASHIVATTDARSGTLRALAEHEGYATLPVPDTVGGRFSILSDVSLFPLAAAGIDIRGILKGAARERDAFIHAPTLSSGPALFAGLQYLAYVKRDQRINVLMPYAEALREFAFWYRQLWAESLGKRKNRKGKDVSVGPTPVASLGATDQHSQIQLYNEGPNDKTVTMIEVERFEHDLHVPGSRLSLERLIHAERKATAGALTKSKRPNGTITIPRITPETMGALVMFFEIAVALSAELHDINAYDQPGVESGKRILRTLL